MNYISIKLSDFYQNWIKTKIAPFLEPNIFFLRMDSIVLFRHELKDALTRIFPAPLFSGGFANSNGMNTP